MTDRSVTAQLVEIQSAHRWLEVPVIFISLEFKD